MSPVHHGSLAIVVVTFESHAVLDACLASLRHAAAAADLWVVDNASSDGSVAVALGHVPDERVLRLPRNGGFAAGVNAALARVRADWIAVVNPDAVVPAGALDRLRDILAAHPRAGLVAPRVRDPRGREEASVGRFPTPARERNHAMKLDRLPGPEGRTHAFPARTAPVDWASGCAWLLRGRAVDDVGALDEGYFMYFDDVDYCRRLWNAGWQVIAAPEVDVVHRPGTGSRATPDLPAENGGAPLRYFAKHMNDADHARARRWLLRGWRLRAIGHGICGRLGRTASIRLAARYRAALALVATP